MSHPATPRQTSAFALARQSAEQAARAAGELLRQETMRDGGVRRSGDSAAVDAEMDAAIRRVLLGAHPEFGLVSEELPAVPGRDPSTWWVVDPHDGTARFLEGERGSAVSIALIHDGEPVVGVVYAPLAPDHAGDLISWHAGGSILRNGEPVVREPWPQELDGRCIVALNSEGDNDPEGFTDAMHGARFRTIACPAYRLALAAVGEVDAAALRTPLYAWDLAGGHALVLGAGGVVVSEEGRPVRYARGERVVGRCYAGAPAVAAALRGCKWPTAPKPAYGVLPPPRHLGHVADAHLLSRAQGCLLGLFAGDSLGQMVEFCSAETIRRRYPDGIVRMADGGTWNLRKGQPTDDGELALSLAAALLSAGTHDPARVFASYRLWQESGPFDIGTTTRAALAGHRDARSRSNGALMRVAPLALFLADRSVPEIIEAARLDATLTHVSPVARDANAAFVLGIVFALRADPLRSSSKRARSVLSQVMACADRFAFHPEVRQALLDAWERKPLPRFDGADQGTCLLALRNAYHQLLWASSLESALLETVRAGGDTDTTAAIAGALLGALRGRDAVPLEWRRAVLTARATRARRTIARPGRYWPVHLLQLAEALLMQGHLERADAPKARVVKQGQLAPGFVGTVTWQPDLSATFAPTLALPEDVPDDAQTMAEHLADAWIVDQLLVPAAGISIRAGHVIHAFIEWLADHDQDDVLGHAGRDADARFSSAHQVLWRRLHRHGAVFTRVDDEPYWHGVRFLDPRRMELLAEQQQQKAPVEYATLLGPRRFVAGLPAHQPVRIEDWPAGARARVGHTV